MELIKPQKQKVWKWPAVVNFTCGGIGTGFYLLALLVTMPSNGNWLALVQANSDWFSLAFYTAVFKLVGPLIVAIGFAALTTEAGRPQRGINLFRHLRRSWMSRETLAFAIFAPFAVLDWLAPSPWLRAIAAIGAIFLMFCQGMIPYRARGVTAWNVSLMPIYFITSGFATGSGLLFVVLALLGMTNLSAMPTLFIAVWIATIALISDLFIWTLYLGLTDHGFQRATSELRKGRYLAGVIAAGHIFPALLFVGALLGWWPPQYVLAMAGILCIFGGARSKWGIVIDAGYLRAIFLSVPQSFAQRLEAAKSI